jgi:signal transduction histidine kinase
MADSDTRTVDTRVATKLDLADAAHQLLTPLTAIMGYADLLGVADDPETIRKYVSVIRSNARLLNRMLTELGEGRMPSVPADKKPARRRPR